MINEFNSIGSKGELSDLGKQMIDYDHSYRKETKKLLGIKTCIFISFLLFILILIFANGGFYG